MNGFAENPQLWLCPVHAPSWCLGHLPRQNRQKHLSRSSYRKVTQKFVDCKQFKITEVKLWSEEPWGSVDIGTVVSEKVKSALGILQRKFWQWELSHHSIAFSGSHQNYSEEKWDHFVWLKIQSGHWKRNTFHLASISPTCLFFWQIGTFLGWNMTEFFLTFEDKVFLTEL